MELINLAILVKDVDYGSAVAWSIVRNTKGMEVWVYDDPACLLKDGEKIKHDLFIMSDDWRGEIRRDADAVLVEKASEERLSVAEGVDLIYKYGNVKDLIDRLYLRYTQKTGRGILPDTSRTCQLYTFVSEHGGSGCTAAAGELAKEFSHYRNMTALIVSLAQFTDEWQPRGDGERGTLGKRNLKQFLYQLICREHAAEHSAMDSYTAKDDMGVAHFIYPHGLNPLLELYESGFVKFLNAVCASGFFDAVIIDAGSQLSMQMVRSMQMSDIVYFVTDGREKNIGWRRCMEGIIDSRTINKLVPVKRKYGIV